MHAQQPLEDVLPDAPTSATSSDVQQPQKAKPESKLEKRSFRLLQSLFVSSVHADMSTTVDFLHHPQHVEYRAMCGVQPCQDILHGYSPLWFTEVGRPAKVFGCSPRGVGCSLVSNIANNATVFGLAEFLHHKGKLGKTIAWGLVTAQTVTNFRAVWHNKHVTLNDRLYVPSGATDISWYNLQ